MSCWSPVLDFFQPRRLSQGFQEPVTISVTLRTRTRRPPPVSLPSPWALHPLAVTVTASPPAGLRGSRRTPCPGWGPSDSTCAPGPPRNRQTPGLRHAAWPPQPVLLPASPPFSRRLTRSLWRAGFRLLGVIQEVCRHHPQGTCWGVQSHTLGEGSLASQLSRIRFHGLTLRDPGSPGFGGNRPAAASGYGFFPLLSDQHCSVDGLQAGGGCGSLWS